MNETTEPTSTAIERNVRHGHVPAPQRGGPAANAHTMAPGSSFVTRVRDEENRLRVWRVTHSDGSTVDVSDESSDSRESYKRALGIAARGL